MGEVARPMFLRPIRSLWPLSLAALAPLASPQGKVEVVDASGGTPGAHLDIQPAVDAASSGHTVLVKAGGYGGFVVDAKSLVVTADAGAAVTIGPVGGGPIEIRNLTAVQTVVLYGISSTRDLRTEHGLHVHDNQGSVWIEKCTFGVDAVGGLGTLPTVELRQNARVSLIGVEAIGYAGEAFPNGDLHPATPAAIASFSTLVFADCTFTGGVGYDGILHPTLGPLDGEDAAAAVVLVDSFLVLDGGEYRAVPGGDGLPFPCTDGGDAAPGLLVSTAQCQVYDRGATLFGSLGGKGILGCSADGATAGGLFLALGAFYIMLPGDGGTMTSDSPRRVGQNVKLDFEGTPGSSVIFGIGLAPQYLYLGQFSGVIQTLPIAILSAGALDPATGTLSISLGVGPLVPPDLADTLYVQPVFINALAQVTLGAPTAVTVLDASL